MSPRRRMPALAVLASVLTVTGCIGPAPTTGAYEQKALRAAEACVSETQTAILAVETSRHGRLPASYLEVLLGESEEAAASIQSQFDSIQPPDTQTADRLKDELDALLSASLEGLTQLRIMARRHDSPGLAETAGSLGDTAFQLQTFAQEHGG